MRILRTVILFILILLQFTSCSTDPEEKEQQDCNAVLNSIDFSFGINYSEPDTYLIPGEQSALDDSYLDEIRNSIGDPGDSIEYVLRVCQWINRHFTFENAGGNMIGANSVNELFEIRTYYGCHSIALIISSVLRKFGFPAIMVETAEIQWAYDYYAGSVQHFSGHVMSEIYVGDKWILLDNNCTYVKDYNPSNPYIPSLHSSPDSYFVFAKGKDIWAYTRKDDSFTHDQLIYFAENIHCFESMFNSVEYIWSD